MFGKNLHTGFAAFCLILLLLGDLSVSNAQKKNKTDWRMFLQNLSGTWDLTGRMESVELHQRCEGRWVLDNHFFQLDCEAIPPDTSGYRSKYVIGYHSEKKQYLFHLFDTFGGSYAETIGRGTREGNRIPFLFDYPQGPFKNIFVWDEGSREWKMILSQQNEEGEWKLFAEKTLNRTD